jgi:hypothetical protein
MGKRFTALSCTNKKSLVPKTSKSGQLKRDSMDNSALERGDTEKDN